MTDPNDSTTLSEATVAINAALKSLQRLGRSDLADGIIADAEQSSTYTALDADTEHNQDYLRTAYARRYIAVMSGLARKLTAAAKSTGIQDADDAARVFGVKGLPGDVASLAISRRDAGDRLADISDSVTLQRLLDTAVRSGDVVLAHAIAEDAVTNGYDDVVNTFIAAYPELGPAIERLWNAAHRQMGTMDLKVAWRVAALKPATLKPLMDYEIAAAATGNTTVGRWSVNL